MSLRIRGLEPADMPVLLDLIDGLLDHKNLAVSRWKPTRTARCSSTN
jgi:hypothetical protein